MAVVGCSSARPRIDGATVSLPPAPQPEPARVTDVSRRAAVRALGALVVSLGVAALPGHARVPDPCDGHAPRKRAPRHAPRAHGAPHPHAVRHPAPRPGITAAAVLPAGRLPRRVRATYDRARRIPEVLDGIYCHCDCAERDGLRSLLSCFETPMVNSCRICAGQAKLAYDLHQRGKSLDEIRAAIDAEYGD